MPRTRRSTRRRARPSSVKPPDTPALLARRIRSAALEYLAAAATTPHSPASESSSPSSDVCDDYYTNLVTEGMRLAGPASDDNGLDLLRGLPDHDRADHGDDHNEYSEDSDRHGCVPVVDVGDQLHCPDWALSECRSRIHHAEHNQLASEGQHREGDAALGSKAEENDWDSRPLGDGDGDLSVLQSRFRPDPTGVEQQQYAPQEDPWLVSVEVPRQVEAASPAIVQEKAPHDQPETGAPEDPEPEQAKAMQTREEETEVAPRRDVPDEETDLLSNVDVQVRPAPASSDGTRTDSETADSETAGELECEKEKPTKQHERGRKYTDHPERLQPETDVTDDANTSQPKLSRPSKPLSPSAAPFEPSNPPSASPPSLSPSAVPSTPAKPAVGPSSQTDVEFAAPPLPQMTFRSPADRADWNIVEKETVSAYRHFKANSQPGATYTCPPMPGAKARLAMHRAAEVLGCRSLSAGEADERRVVLTWTKNGMFPISETSVVFAVRAVLLALFPPAKLGKIQSKASADPARQQLLEERKAKRKQQKLEAAVKVADAGVDPALVSLFVERQDWYALELLYKGVKVPGLNKKKKKAKAKAKAEQAEALQQMPAGIPIPFPPPPFAPGFVPPPPPGVAPWFPGPFSGHRLPVIGPPVAQMHLQSQVHYQGIGGSESLYAQPLGRSNKGYGMLEKMGWKEGEGLGSEKKGRKEPLHARKLTLRSGLGSDS